MCDSKCPEKKRYHVFRVGRSKASAMSCKFQPGGDGAPGGHGRVITDKHVANKDFYRAGGNKKHYS